MDSRKIELYHGSGQIVEFPEIRKTRYTKDFSWGFYCTNSYEQAYRWADRKHAQGVVNIYSYIEDPRLNIKKFDKMSDEWLNFIAECRAGKIHEYDIVEGPMADDQIWNFVEGFIDGKIPRDAFWGLVRFNYPTHQIVFCTESALKTLTFEGSETL